MKTSVCCGAEITGVGLDYEICPDCLEHCEMEDENEDENEDNIQVAEPIRTILNDWYQSHKSD